MLSYAKLDNTINAISHVDFSHIAYSGTKYGFQIL